jgi:Spy/CpxP family protein refolding chaperone
MHRLLLAGLAGLAFVFAAAAQAQPPLRPDPPPRGMLPRQQDEMPGPLIGEAPGAELPGADPFQLLLNSFEVQHELRLTPDQLDRLQLAARNFRTQMQGLIGPHSGMSNDQARAAIAAQMMDTRAMIARELMPEQLARLQQIVLQLEGPCLAMADAQIGQQLSLTDDQWHQLGAVCSGRMQQMRAAFQPPAPGQDVCQVAAGNRDRIEVIRARSDEQALAVLSPRQRSQFTGMQGRRINLEPPVPPECRLPPRR